MKKQNFKIVLGKNKENDKEYIIYEGDQVIFKISEKNWMNEDVKFDTEEAKKIIFASLKDLDRAASNIEDIFLEKEKYKAIYDPLSKSVTVYQNDKIIKTYNNVLTSIRRNEDLLPFLEEIENVTSADDSIGFEDSENEKLQSKIIEVISNLSQDDLKKYYLSIVSFLKRKDNHFNIDNLNNVLEKKFSKDFALNMHDLYKKADYGQENADMIKWDTGSTGQVMEQSQYTTGFIYSQSAGTSSEVKPEVSPLPPSETRQGVDLNQEFSDEEDLKECSKCGGKFSILVDGMCSGCHKEFLMENDKLKNYIEHNSSKNAEYKFNDRIFTVSGVSGIIIGGPYLIENSNYYDIQLDGFKDKLRLNSKSFSKETQETKKIAREDPQEKRLKKTASHIRTFIFDKSELGLPNPIIRNYYLAGNDYILNRALERKISYILSNEEKPKIGNIPTSDIGIHDFVINDLSETPNKVRVEVIILDRSINYMSETADDKKEKFFIKVSEKKDEEILEKVLNENGINNFIKYNDEVVFWCGRDKYQKVLGSFDSKDEKRLLKKAVRWRQTFNKPMESYVICPIGFGVDANNSVGGQNWGGATYFPTSMCSVCPYAGNPKTYIADGGVVCHFDDGPQYFNLKNGPGAY